MLNELSKQIERTFFFRHNNNNKNVHFLKKKEIQREKDKLLLKFQ